MRWCHGDNDIDAYAAIIICCLMYICIYYKPANYLLLNLSLSLSICCFFNLWLDVHRLDAHLHYHFKHLCNPLLCQV
ncbi:hypothetical protein L6452_37069 [Arctium lappa]|uniref:Uncharacterized protein n=1 Tax=Arctium lappa TaxID=4217 RepID=A0ACB8Y1W6_ARCLA|nr:hypothetical protein L6452_37069 [Arctium lappa]